MRFAVLRITMPIETANNEHESLFRKKHGLDEKKKGI
jgi:hypothetical protein